MKKVFLKVFLFFLIISMVGCGEKKEKQNSTNEQKTPSEQIEKTEISSVLQGFEEGSNEALISLKGEEDTYYVVDADGNIKYKFQEPKLKSSSSYVYRNGYFVFNYQEDTSKASENDVNYVKDLKTGEILYNGDENTKYLDVTEDGSVLVHETKEDLSGKKYYSRIIDKEGKKVWEYESKFVRFEYFKVVTKNMVLFSPISYEKYRMINALTGKEIDLGLSGSSGYLDVSIYNDKILFGISANNDKYQIIDSVSGEVTKTNLSHVHQILNDKFVYATPLWGTVGIYDYQGKLVKDLTEGQVDKIIYLDNTYYVISRTGFYYALNDDLSYKLEPKKIVGDTKNLQFTTVGIEVTDDLSKYKYIPYSEFDPEKDLESQIKEINGRVENSNSLYGFINSSNTYKMVKFPSLEEVSIKK